MCSILQYKRNQLTQKETDRQTDKWHCAPADGV